MTSLANARSAPSVDMTLAEREREIAIARAYPSQRDAAKMLGISEASLSRSSHQPISAGARNKHYPPSAVLEAATAYRKRSLNEVAGELVAYAAEHAPEHADGVRDEVEAFFATRMTPPTDKQKFLEQAQRTLPRRLYLQIKRAYEQGSDDAPLNFASDGDQSSALASR